MKINNPPLIVLILCLGMLWSCQPEDDITPVDTHTFVKESAQTVLGRKLENPYSVANMRKAWSNLEQRGRISGSADIVATHYYVKFTPQTEEEFDRLRSDSTLILYDYPLDYEIERPGDYYHDPDVPEDRPTPQYCSVKVDYVFPDGVGYELLEDLFIPDDYSDDASASARLADDGTIEALVDEALRMTGNEEEVVGGDERGRVSSGCGGSWRPAGRITVWDDSVKQTQRRWKHVFDRWEYFDCWSHDEEIWGNGRDDKGNPYLVDYNRGKKRLPKRWRRAVYRSETEEYTAQGGYVGLEGVEVRARRWFTTHVGIANSQGRFSCNGTFLRPANYSIKWIRHQFLIRTGWLFTSAASYGGPKKCFDWNLRIKNGEQEFHGTIFRAAYHYYYSEDIKGLRRPPQNSFWRPQLKIRARYEYSEDHRGFHEPGRRFLGTGNPVQIYNPDNSTPDIYGTVIHELAHASHWNMDRSSYNGDLIVAESWARGVQWVLTRTVYPTYKPPYSRLRYTGVVQDLIDGVKTRTSENYWSESNPWVYLFRSYEDSVSGYTIRQLEDALIGQRTWLEWKNNIKRRYSNDTENHVDEAFRFWSTR